MVAVVESVDDVVEVVLDDVSCVLGSSPSAVHPAAVAASVNRTPASARGCE